MAAYRQALARLFRRAASSAVAPYFQGMLLVSSAELPSTVVPPPFDTAEAFWTTLERFGDRVALRDSAGRSITYAELAARGDSFARSLPPWVALIALEARNELESVIAYVGCLRRGRPVLLVAAGDGEQSRKICAPYRPEATYARSDQDWSLQTSRSSGAAVPHADLAVLLPTSGTMGNAKLVRLSKRNIASNAQAIATYLGLTPDDRTVSTLPFCFAYGMSVLHAHLAVGGTVLLTDHGPLDDAFWEFARREAATTLALVPHHFDPLDTVGMAQRLPPTLRVLTQAGGRLAEGRVRKILRLADKNHFQFFVMYGQTEAAPRMAFLPPAEAMANPATVGGPIPGGSFEIRDEQGVPITTPGVQGELVYRGPNVMMGYAETRADLARGAELTELRTGDVAAFTSSGHLRIAGRLSRFVKLNGLRISLDDVEEFLEQAGHKAACVGDDQRLTVFAEGKADRRAIRMLIGVRHKIQPSHIVVVDLAEVPRNAAGKIDYPALQEIAVRHAPRGARKSVDGGLREAMAVALSRKSIADNDTFTSLGGDSLAFLEVYLALERQLGHVPPRWESRTIAELEALAPRTERRMRVPFNLLVRLAAVAEVIGLHAHTWTIGGGAFVLLALAGYSLAQFQSANILEGRFVRTIATLFPRLLIAYFAIVLAYGIAEGGLNPLWLLLLGNFSHEESTFIEPLWFIPAYLQVVLLFLAVTAFPAVRRAMKLSPWQTAVAFLAGALALRLGTEALTADPITLMRSPVGIVHLFALGWCMQHADTTYRKAVLTALATAVAFAFWNTNVGQSVFIAVCCAAVLWIDAVSLPKRVGHAVTAIGSASFFIYLVHMLPVHLLEVTVPLDDYVTAVPAFAVILVLSVSLGLLAHAAVTRAVTAARRGLRRRPEEQLAPEW